MAGVPSPVSRVARSRLSRVGGSSRSPASARARRAPVRRARAPSGRLRDREAAGRTMKNTAANATRAPVTQGSSPRRVPDRRRQERRGREHLVGARKRRSRPLGARRQRPPPARPSPLEHECHAPRRRTSAKRRCARQLVHLLMKPLGERDRPRVGPLPGATCERGSPSERRRAQAAPRAPDRELNAYERDPEGHERQRRAHPPRKPSCTPARLREDSPSIGPTAVRPARDFHRTRSLASERVAPRLRRSAPTATGVSRPPWPPPP